METVEKRHLSQEGKQLVEFLPLILNFLFPLMALTSSHGEAQKETPLSGGETAGRIHAALS